MKKVKCLLAAIVIMSTLGLSGCAGKAVSLTNPTQAMSEVCERNIQVLKTFLNQGLISEAQYSHYETSLRERAATYTKLITEAQDAKSEEDEAFKATLEMLQNSLVHRIGEEKEDGGYYGNISAGGTCSDGDDFYYLSNPTNEININEFSNLMAGGKKEKYAMNGKGDAASPLIFIDENNLDSLLKEINRQVYILDENKLKTDADWKHCIEALYNVKNADEKDEETYNHLKEVAVDYFKPTNYTVYNFTKDDIIKVSEDNSESLGSSSGGNALNKDIIINGLMTIKEHKHTTDKNGDEDCEIEETTKSLGVYSLRVQEFNGDFYNKVSNEVYTNNKYLALQPTEGEDVGVALLMEYPVSVIDSLEADGENAATWHFNLKDTDMRINIYNGEMLVKNADGSYVKVNAENKEEDKIYRVLPANVGLDLEEGKKTSFTPFGAGSLSKNEIIVLDTTEEQPEEDQTAEAEQITEELGNSEQISTVRFALRDYLELTYMPGVVDGEKFIATGRKITINEFSGNADEILGYFVDRLGDAFKNATGEEIAIKASDVIDYASGSTDFYEKVGICLKFAGNLNSNEVEEELSKQEDFRVSNLYQLLQPNNTKEDSGLVTNKEQLNYSVYVEKLNPILQFTSSGDENIPALDAEDVDNQEVAPSLYYGLCVNTNMFNTGLYTTWINPNSSDVSVDVLGHNSNGGSLKWWNNWLALHSYNYYIDIDTLIKRMSNVYAVTLADMDDTFIYDLDTIAVINRDMQRENEENTKSLIKTVQTLIGAVLLVYGMMMLACWFIDVNLVNGPGFLTIITGGKFVAIRDMTEMPRMVDDKVYVDFKYLIVVMILFMCLGIVLIVFNIQDIRDLIIRVFGGIFELFKNLMLNK